MHPAHSIGSSMTWVWLHLIPYCPHSRSYRRARDHRTHREGRRIFPVTIHVPLPSPKETNTRVVFFVDFRKLKVDWSFWNITLHFPHLLSKKTQLIRADTFRARICSQSRLIQKPWDKVWSGNLWEVPLGNDLMKENGCPKRYPKKDPHWNWEWLHGT